MIRTSHKHVEAFRLMTYVCANGHTHKIWNSRDGSAPFLAGCRFPGCVTLMQCVNLQSSTYNPDYVLSLGELYWRDIQLADVKIIIGRLFLQTQDRLFGEERFLTAAVETRISKMAEAFMRKSKKSAFLDRWENSG